MLESFAGLAREAARALRAAAGRLLPTGRARAVAVALVACALVAGGATAAAAFASETITITKTELYNGAKTVHKFDLSGSPLGSTVGYCAAINAPAPPAGTSWSGGEWYPSGNAKLDYILYHGYRDGQTSGYGVSGDSFRLCTEYAVWLVSDAPDNDPSYALSWANKALSGTQRAAVFGLVDDATAYANNGGGGEEAGCSLMLPGKGGNQSMVAFRIANGEVKLRKVGSNSALTANNPCYDLAGAVYGVYSDSACTNEVGRLTTDGNGDTNTISLTAGTYWVKELTPSKGYALDPEVHQVTVGSGATATVESSEPPKHDPGDMTIAKLDATTGQATAEGAASLAGAEFTVRFYAGWYSESNLPATPTREWVFKTDERGETSLYNAFYTPGTYLVRGDEFYTDSNGIPCFPLGTLAIQETKAPEGYLLPDPSPVFVQQIRDEGDNETVHVLNDQQAPDEVIRGGVEVQKWDALMGSTTPVGDADFAGIEISITNRTGGPVTVDGKTYADGEVCKVLVLDADGHAESGDHALPFGTYELRETKTNQWYRPNEGWSRTFRVETDGQVATFDAADASPVDAPIRGDVEVQKRDLDTDLTTPQGEASFEGAEVTVTNRSANAVKVLGHVRQPGEAVLTLVLDAAGHATTKGMDPDDGALPVGTYELTETKAPEGYVLNDTWRKVVQVREDGKVYAVTDPAGGELAGTSDTSAVPDRVIRGGVRVQKWDADLAELGQPTHSGDAAYEGIELSIYNRTGHDVFVDGKSVAPDAVAKVLVLDAEGRAESGDHALPYGTYEVTETKTNQWYRPNEGWTQTFRVVEDGHVFDLTPADKGPVDAPIRGDVEVQKRDLMTDWTRPQGEASFEGAEVSITNRSANAVRVEGKVYQPGEVVKVITTDEGGLATTRGAEGADGALPAGTYELRETKAPEGYLLNTTWTKTVRVREDGKVYEVTDEAGADDAAGKSETSGVPDQVIRGGLDVQKFDADLESATHSGDADYAGIELTVWNRTGNDVVVDGKVVADGKAAKVLVLDAEGRASTGDHALPYGTYEVTETKTNQWYRPNETWRETFRVTADGQVFHASGYERDEATNQLTGPADAPIRGDVDVQKRDIETDLAVPQGAARFEGAEISITNRSANAVKVDGGVFQPGEVVKVITTDEGGLATTRGGPDGALPAGTYELTETKAPEGYLLNTRWKKVVRIREDGKAYEVTAEAGKLDEDGKADDSGVPDWVKRGEARFDKASLGTDQPLALVAFKVTSKTTGETHVVVTDADGSWDSSPSRASHMTYTDADGVEHATNANDALLGEGGWQVGDESKLDPKAGTWFYGASEPNGAEPSDERGALPYDTYEFEELRSKSNEGFQLIKFELTVSRDSYRQDGGVQKDVKPTMETTLTDGEGMAELPSKADTRLVDTVRLGSLQRGKEFALTMKLWDATDQRFLQEGGKDIEVRKVFTAEGEGDYVDMTLTQEATVDARGLAGHMVVAYEYLDDEHDVRLVEHADEDDLVQAVTFAKIGTTATAPDGNKDVPATSGARILDKVDYEGLRRGNTYTLRATVHVRGADGSDGGALKGADGKEVSVTKAFVAQAWKGSVTVEIPLDATALEGSSLVVYEELWLGKDVGEGGHELTSHEDPSEEGQTVRVPRIGTLATGEDGTKAVRAAADATLTDTVSYENLTPGVEYTVTGTLHYVEGGDAVDTSRPAKDFVSTLLGLIGAAGDDPAEDATDAAATDAGVVLDGAGNPVSASATFTPEAASGTVDVEFKLDASALAGRKTVVFERLERGGVEYARHEQPGDKGQTVGFPDAKTTLTDGEGNHDVAATGTVRLVDHVAYSGLVPGRRYTVTGTLMDKASGQPAKGADGKEITAKADFTPEASSGTVDVTFEFDASALAGHRLVAYETVSSDGRDWVTHADIDDHDQTVSLPKIGTTLAGEDGAHEVASDGEVTLVDHVAYENLEPETEYDLSGVLHVRDADGSDLGVLLDDGSVWNPATGQTTRLEAVKVDMAAHEAYVAPDTAGGEGTGPDAGAEEGEAAQARTLQGSDETSYLGVGEDGLVAGTYAARVRATGLVRVSVIRGGVLAQDGSGMQGGTTVSTAAVPSGAEMTVRVTLEEGDYLSWQGTGTISLSPEGAEAASAAPRAAAQTSAGGDAEPEAAGADASAGGTGAAVPGVTARQLEASWGSLPDNAVRASATFRTGKAADGQDGVSGGADVTFSFRMPSLAGRTLVAFEALGRAGRQVAVHADVSDEGQTVTVPAIGTTLVDAEDADHSIVAGHGSLVDMVGYENLLPGTTYKVSGTLHVRDEAGADAGTLMSDGSVMADPSSAPEGVVPVTGEATFVTPDAKEGERRVSGTAQVTFEWPDTTQLAGRSVVAFESLQRAGVEVASHADISDDAQAVAVVARPGRPGVPQLLAQTGGGILAAALLVGGAVAVALGARRLRRR